jgi:hypothetical protein
MSEYVTVETELTDHPDEIEIYTNQRLSRNAPEVYANRDSGSIGSPLAQTLFYAMPGILALTIHEDSLTITRDPGYTWEVIVDDVRDALRDFFL